MTIKRNGKEKVLDLFLLQTKVISRAKTSSFKVIRKKIKQEDEREVLCQCGEATASQASARRAVLGSGRMWAASLWPIFFISTLSCGVCVREGGTELFCVVLLVIMS